MLFRSLCPFVDPTYSTCPVCAQTVPVSEINDHLDECLQSACISDSWTADASGEHIFQPPDLSGGRIGVQVTELERTSAADLLRSCSQPPASAPVTPLLAQSVLVGSSPSGQSTDTDDVQVVGFGPASALIQGAFWGGVSLLWGPDPAPRPH